MPDMLKRFHWISVKEQLFLAFGNLNMKHILRLDCPQWHKEKTVSWKQQQNYHYYYDYYYNNVCG